MKLYHVSPTKFVYLDPTKSKAIRMRAWLCTKKLIPWALNHVAKHHGCRTTDLYIYTFVAIRRELVIPWREGIYTTTHILKAAERRKNK